MKTADNTFSYNHNLLLHTMVPCWG